MKNKNENAAYEIVCKMIDWGFIESEPEGINMEHQIQMILEKYYPRKGMSEKERFFSQIVKYLKKKNATKENPVVHDIYILKYDGDCIGKMLSAWIGDDNTPMCKVDWWGITTETRLYDITARNLETLRDYLRDGKVVQ